MPNAAVRTLDQFQQRHTVVGFPVALAKKFADDRGGNLAALLAYYGFLALFPLLLVLTTVLGFVGNERLADSVVGTTLEQFPVIGAQIGSDAPRPLEGSIVALVVGLGGLLYGALGVTQAAQQAMGQVWNVPEVARPGFVGRLWRGLLALVGAGVAVAVSTALGGLATVAGRAWPLRLLLALAGVAWMVVVYLAAFRLLTPRPSTVREMLPGAVAGGVAYSALLLVGTALVQHRLRNAQAVYGQFAFTLGLIGWLYLVAQVSLYAAEINVVRHRRLWPRSLQPPPLTAADERVLHDLAHQQRRRPEEEVGVGFEPQGHREVAADAARNDAPAPDPAPPPGTTAPSEEASPPGTTATSEESPPPATRR